MLSRWKAITTQLKERSKSLRSGLLECNANKQKINKYKNFNELQDARRDRESMSIHQIRKSRKKLRGLVFGKYPPTGMDILARQRSNPMPLPGLHL
jgi:hypothetical protein